MTRAGVLDLLVHHAAAELLHGLVRGHVLDLLRSPRTSAEIADDLALDAHLLERILAFLAANTDVIRRRRHRYVLAPGYARSQAWCGMLEKLVGAYGPAFRDAHAALHGRAAAIDGDALARAYAHDIESALVIETIRALAPRGVLDLGCGRGQLLAAVCADSAVRGWGIDASPAMCRAARATVRAAGLTRRVAIHHGHAAAPHLLSAAARAHIDVIHAGSLFNAMMAEPARAVAVLARLARGFPGRTLVVVDYLGGTANPGRYTQLTDLGQLLTGQGTPPTTHRRWAALYTAVGAVLVSAAEATTFDLRWFLHVVRLPSRPERP